MPIGEAENGHRQRRPARRMIITVAPSSPSTTRQAQRQRRIIRRRHRRQASWRRRYHGEAPGWRRRFNIAEIRASPVVTLLKVKAEISTKCAARTIKGAVHLQRPRLNATRMPSRRKPRDGAGQIKPRPRYFCSASRSASATHPHSSARSHHQARKQRIRRAAGVNKVGKGKSRWAAGHHCLLRLESKITASQQENAGKKRHRQRARRATRPNQHR